MRRGIAVFALMITTTAGCGATNAPTDTSAGDSGQQTALNAAKIGESRVVKGQSGTAEVTIVSVTVHAKGKGDIAEAPANGQYAVVDIQIQATEKTFEVNPLYVKYQAADGTTFDMTAGNSITAGFEPQLDAGSVPAGQSVRGVVVFDIPSGNGKQIQLTDELGKIIGVWNL